MNTIHVEPETSSLHRLPGLFRRWELAQIIEAGDYHVEEAGAASDGTPLYAVYRHRPDEPIVARAEVP